MTKQIPSTDALKQDVQKGTHDPLDCMDRAQLMAWFEDAQRVKPVPKPADKNIDLTPEQKKNWRWGF